MAITKGKRYAAVKEKVQIGKVYTPEEAFDLIFETKSAKFVETVEIALRLGVDPRHADQQVRGTVVLPNGTGKTVRILAIAEGEKAKEAEAAGADIVGSDEILQKIQGGWLDFDLVIATPDMMPKLGRLGKVLGPKGLMPNPKSGTVTPQIGEAVSEFKKGKLAFRVDKLGSIHSPLGKVNFEKEKIIENFKTFLDTVVKLKPSSSKGQYLRSVTISLTMGPGIKIDPLLAQKYLENK
jgi:large subunit ribosomal protein L1